MAKEYIIKRRGDCVGATDSDLSTSSFQTVEYGSLDNATSEMAMEVVSTSNNDDLTGTGAQKVKLTYLDSNFNQYEEIISMDGTNSVQTSASNIMHIERFEVIQVGSTGENQGEISLRHISDSPIYASIEQGKNEFFSCVHHIANGTIAYVTGMQLVNRTSGTVKIRMTYEKIFENGGQVNKIYDEESLGSYESILREFLSPLEVHGGNHIRIMAKASIDNQEVSVRLYYYEV